MAGILDFLSGSGDPSQNGLLNWLQNNAAYQPTQQPSPFGFAPPQTPNDRVGGAFDALGQQPSPIAPPPMAMAGPSLNQPAPLSSAPQSPSAPSTQEAADPIKVGNYSMPRIGNADLFDPAEADLPPKAAPAAGTAPLSMAGPQQPAAPASPGFGDRLMSSLQSFNNTNSGGLFGKLTNGITSLVTGQRSDPAFVQGNQTAQALLAKGVDPTTVKAAIGNPELMKKLFDSTFTPPPAGFAGASDGLHYIPGGPADPAYLQAKAIKENDPNAVKVAGKGAELYKVDANGNIKIVHKNVDNTEATLDDSTTSAMADQYLSGDKSVMQNLGRGAQGAANIVKLRQAIYAQAQAQGLNGKNIVDNFNEQAGALAGQRAVGTRAANISLAANEANNMIPIALAASDKLPRTQYMPWNQMVQAVQKGSSSPELASFVAATNSLVNSYVRAVSPSGVPTDSMREHAYSMLNAAQGPEAYKAVIVTMQKEMQAALAAPSQVKKELRGESAAAPASQGNGADTMLAQARDALAKGAPRDKVLTILQQSGIDASGL